MRRSWRGEEKREEGEVKRGRKGADTEEGEGRSKRRNKKKQRMGDGRCYSVYMFLILVNKALWPMR